MSIGLHFGVIGEALGNAFSTVKQYNVSEAVSGFFQNTKYESNFFKNADAKYESALTAAFSLFSGVGNAILFTLALSKIGI